MFFHCTSPYPSGKAIDTLRAAGYNWRNIAERSERGDGQVLRHGYAVLLYEPGFCPAHLFVRREMNTGAVRQAEAKGLSACFCLSDMRPDKGRNLPPGAFRFRKARTRGASDASDTEAKGMR